MHSSPRVRVFVRLAQGPRGTAAPVAVGGRFSDSMLAWDCTVRLGTSDSGLVRTKVGLRSDLHVGLGSYFNRI